MNFENFKKYFLTYGMFTIDFSFKNDKRNKIRIENYDLKNKGRIIINNTNKQMYTNCIDLFNIKIINEKNIEQLWNELQIDFIDGFLLEEYLEILENININFIDNFYKYLIEKTISKQELINILVEEEYKGNLLLLAGTNEMSNIDISNFDIIIHVPYINRVYNIKSENNDIVINVHTTYIEQLKIDVKKKKNYKVGRMITSYKDKCLKNKSQKYKELLQYEKIDNSSYFGIFVGIIMFLSFDFIIVTITNVKELPFLWIIAILLFILLWMIFLKISKYRRKKQEDFRNKYFPKNTYNKNNQINPVILEKYNQDFNSLFNKIKDKIPDIKIVNYGIEHNEIDISLSKNNKELFLVFSNKYLSIYDEDENESYYLFDKYTFEELEDEITDFAYKYFIEI